MFTGIGLIPPATAVNYVPWAIVGFVSQYIIRRRHFAFWAKYNCGCSRPVLGGTSDRMVLQMYCLPRLMQAPPYQQYWCTFGVSLRASRGWIKLTTLRQPAIPAQRSHWPKHYRKVVGEHGVQEHGGLAGHAAAAVVARGDIRVSARSALLVARADDDDDAAGRDSGSVFIL